jgi:hypothetical protein
MTVFVQHGQTGRQCRSCQSVRKCRAAEKWFEENDPVEGVVFEYEVLE